MQVMDERNYSERMRWFEHRLTDRLMDIFDSIVAFATENITTRLLLLLGGKDESKDLNISGPL